MRRTHALFQGIVQGVGFRPFVYRAAASRELTGWVSNGPDGVRLEVQGCAASVAAFLDQLTLEPPEGSEIRNVSTVDRPTLPEEAGFRVLCGGPAFAASASGGANASMPPDRAACKDCRAEVSTQGGRRHGYAFTSCTACGPRATVVEALPYERENTTMRRFALCALCRDEYETPSDRRFHAQTIACPACGPQLRFLDTDATVDRPGDPLANAAQALSLGKIVAVLGLGGFQLLVNASDEAGVARLRERKRRPHKPFAVMFRDAAQLAGSVELRQPELDALESPQAPIVLLTAMTEAPVAANIAPGLRTLGGLLPSTPLHQLLLGALDFPVVCTSGNLSGEPLCTTLGEAQSKLRDIADGFLTHDRPLARAMDDSVVQFGVRGAELIRRARGYGPGCVAHLKDAPCTLALGAHFKSTIALLTEGDLIVSEHIGDLETGSARLAFSAVASSLLAFHGSTPKIIACDLHPDYASSHLATTLADSFGCALVRVQHHHAHIAAVLAEHNEHDEVLAFAWDGLGLGTDGKLWGSEVSLCSGLVCRRVGRLGDFALPGGERAQREPRRALLGLCHALGLPLPESCAWHFDAPDTLTLGRMLTHDVNSPHTSSLGRLFDAVAALLGVRSACTYEGQAAIELEQVASAAPQEVGSYTLDAQAGPSPLLPLVSELIADQRHGTTLAVLARRFHNTLIQWGVGHAERNGRQKVVLTGGCFQNRLLGQGLEAALESRGYRVLRPRRLPSHDGQLAAGQAWLAAQGMPHMIDDEAIACA